MKDKTIITIARLVCGAAILITSTVTKMDGILLGVSLFLMAVPVEQLAKEPKE